MTRLLPANAKYALASLCACAGAVGALAQGTADDGIYTGPYRVGDYAGRARYQYDLTVEGDTVREGGFRMEGSDLAALLSGGDSYFAFRGSFRDDVPSDRWRFTFGEYVAEGSADVDGFEYHLLVDGEQRQTTGTLRRGRPDSRWTTEVRRVEASRPTDVLFRSAVTFSGGVPQQSFTVEGGGASLLGRFKRNGVAHDTWTLYSDLDAQEEWTFENGWLRSISGAGPAREVFGEDVGEGRFVDLDERYVQLLSLYLALDGRPVELDDDPAVALLTRNAALYAELGDVVERLGGATADPLFKVMVPHRPLEASDLATLDSIQERITRFDTVAQAIASTTSLRVAESTDAEVAYLRSLLEDLDDRWLAPARRLDSVYRADLLQYLPRDRFYANLGPGGGVAPALRVDYEAPGGEQSRTYRAPRDRPYELATGLAAFSALTRDALAAADSVREVLGVRLVTKERRQVLTALDEEIMSHFNRLDSLVEAQEGALPEEYGLEELRSLARRRLRTYTTLDDALVQREEARALIDCLEHLNALALTLVDLPEERAEIEELYVNEVWNNITATVMEETVKKRLLEAYTRRLVPYFLERVADGLECGDAEAVGEQLRALNARMRQLRDADTERLEQRVRRADNPRRLLGLLEVTPES